MSGVTVSGIEWPPLQMAKFPISGLEEEDEELRIAKWVDDEEQHSLLVVGDGERRNAKPRFPGTSCGILRLSTPWMLF